MPPKPHEIVKFWREKLGLSQAELGQQSGIIQQEIAKIEIGKRRLTADLIKKIAPPLGLLPCDLLSDAAPHERVEEHRLLTVFRSIAEPNVRSQALRVLQALGEASAGDATAGRHGPARTLMPGLHEGE